MRGILLFLWVFALGGALSGAAYASPWARPRGDVFLSFTVSSASSQDQITSGDLDPDNFISAYAEYGLGRRLKLGFDIGRDQDEDLRVVFLRRTFTAPGDTVQIAADIGYGRRATEGEENGPLYRLGFSIGRGFGPNATEWLPFFEPSGGWLVLDMSYHYVEETGDEILQAEATLGLNLSEEFAAILQVKAEEFPGSDPALLVTPSVLYRLRGGPTSFQFGGRFGLSGSDEVGIRLGIWREF